MGKAPLISADKFYKTFINNLKNELLNNKKVINIYTNDKKWTTYIKSFLKKIGETQFQVIVDQEYWPRVDVGFFDKPSENWGNWAFEVAIEVENNINKCHEEICKLLLLKVGLKVLITYYKEKDAVDKILTKFHKVFKSRKYFQLDENWLFIFLPCAYENWETDVILGYKYNGLKVSKLTPEFNLLKP